MNNILSFNEYNGQELETVVYEQELNEKNMLRGFFNKRAARNVKSELAEEIEMSKTIMEGIKSGLESLNENFDAIKKSIEDDGDEKVKGEKQKVLDEITKIIENSRNNTWDLNELIDEGEIDYTGFTANVGIASVAYFGILLTPFRAVVMIHKGYNYFFNIVKNTIRKALVMLQLNFDQFENLIICKGFQSADYAQDLRDMDTIAEMSGKIQAMLFDKDKGSIKNRKTVQEVEKKYKIAMDAIKLQMQQKKSSRGSENAFNCLDSYNNTYTRSLETLRQYSQDDVQKHLDAIKTSMNKLAGQEADLQTYSELIIAAAEEHAYKVSSSIYNKFAKMTEVFSLPNQKKLIELIQAATQEEMNAVDEEAKKINDDNLKKAVEEAEDEGKEVFLSLDGSKVGDLDDETKRYNEDEVEAENWTYEEFSNLEEKKQDVFERWLGNHPEVLKKCGKTLQVAIYSQFNDGYHEYVDYLIDYIEPCLEGGKIEESYILDFDKYFIVEKAGGKKKPEYILNLSGLSVSQINDLKEAFDEDSKHNDVTKIAETAFVVIGKKLLSSKTFSKNAEEMVKTINDAIDDKDRRIHISPMTFKLFKKSIELLKDLRSHDYGNIEDNQKKSDE